MNEMELIKEVPLRLLETCKLPDGAIAFCAADEDQEDRIVIVYHDL